MKNLYLFDGVKYTEFKPDTPERVLELHVWVDNNMPGHILAERCYLGDNEIRLVQRDKAVYLQENCTSGNSLMLSPSGVSRFPAYMGAAKKDAAGYVKYTDVRKSDKEGPTPTDEAMAIIENLLPSITHVGDLWLVSKDDETALNASLLEALKELDELLKATV